MLTGMKEHAFFTSSSLTELLWPTRCALCNKAGYVVCDECLMHLTYIDYWQACPVCGAAYGRHQCPACAQRRLKEAPEFCFARCVSSTIMDEQSSRLVVMRKETGERRLAWVFAALIARVLPPSWIDAHTYVCAPPVRKDALVERGFNHNYDLASALAQICDLHAWEVFEATTSKDQRALSFNERQRNTIELMLRGEMPRECQRMIIVDDVFTTGATLNNCARAIHEHAPDIEICAATFAHGY